MDWGQRFTQPHAIPSPPPAKRTRKAVKRRCEAELLRGGGEWGTLLLSPPHGSPLQSVLPPQPQSPITLPPPQTPPSLLPPGPSSPIRATPEPPSPTTALSDFLTPPPTASVPQSAHEAAAPEDAAPEDAAPEAATPDVASPDAAAPEITTNENSEPVKGPPPPPPWPEAYIFSTDPDRIVCRKCCKRHYNFRWYSHCFMCHMDESRR
jgi:hypothetical protein